MVRALLLLAFAFSVSTAARADGIDDALKGLKSKDAKVRLKAVESLGEAQGDKAASALCEAALDGNQKVVLAALASLGKVSPDLGKHMTSFVLDRAAFNRIDALIAIGRLGDKGAPAMRALTIILTSSSSALAASPKDTYASDVTYRAAEAIRAIGIQDDVTAKSLIELAGSDVGRFSRGSILDALSKWSATSDAANKEFFSKVKNWLSDPQWAKSSTNLILLCKTLGSYTGNEKKDFVPALEKLKLSPIQEVREAAAKALEKLDK